ncbi:hypothetical protein, partial [Pseudomonas oryzihabitans]
PNWIIFISDLKDFCRRTNITAEEMNMLLKNGPKTAIHFIIGSEYAYVGQSFEEVPRLVRDHVETGLVSMRLSDQDVFKQSYISNEKYPKP